MRRQRKNLAFSIPTGNYKPYSYSIHFNELL